MSFNKEVEHISDMAAMSKVIQDMYISNIMNRLTEGMYKHTELRELVDHAIFLHAKAVASVHTLSSNPEAYANKIQKVIDAIPEETKDKLTDSIALKKLDHIL